jgi:hypothetical protein
MRPAQAGCGRKRRGGGRQQTLRAGSAQAGWAVMNERHNAADERFHPCPGGRHWGPRRGGHPPLHRSGRRPHMGAAVPSIPARPARRHLVDVRRRYRRGRDRVAGCGPRDLQGNPGDHAGSGRHCRGYVWECPQGCGWTYTTFVVRVPLHSGGSLPRVRVARGRAAWETAGLAWVPAGQV